MVDNVLMKIFYVMVKSTVKIILMKANVEQNVDQESGSVMTCTVLMRIFVVMGYLSVLTLLMKKIAQETCGNAGMVGGSRVTNAVMASITVMMALMNSSVNLLSSSLFIKHGHVVDKTKPFYKYKRKLSRTLAPHRRNMFGGGVVRSLFPVSFVTYYYWSSVALASPRWTDTKVNDDFPYEEISHRFRRQVVTPSVKQGCAGDDQFICLGGGIICADQRCDGYPDCEEEDDEAGCDCEETEFQCDGAKCIDQSKVCDMVKDCADNSDEENCPTSSLPYTTPSDCEETEFQCDGAKCIDQSKVCDMVKDCADNSDEENCPTSSLPYTTPSVPSVHCRDDQAPALCEDGKTYACYCDGIVDCEYGEDEVPSRCSGQGCTGDNFECDSGICISNSKKCDGVEDCLDGFDELGCTSLSPPQASTTTIETTSFVPSSPRNPTSTLSTTTNPVNPSTLPLSGYSSPTGTSSGSSAFADTTSTYSTTTLTSAISSTIPTAASTSNPVVTTHTTASSSTVTPVPGNCGPYSWQCRDSSCIPEVNRCDGLDHCPDNSDEDGCPIGNCGPCSWQCRDSSCIPEVNRCDGLSHCSDNSDEEGCSAGCKVGEWQCNNGHCIEIHNRCDGSADCEDFSDEKYCRSECTTGMWPCCEKCCIPAKFVCDGVPHCPYASDENYCMEISLKKHLPLHRPLCYGLSRSKSPC